MDLNTIQIVATTLGIVAFIGVAIICQRIDNANAVSKPDPKNWISIEWSIYDVQDRATDNKIELSLSQAQEVLYMMEKNHDANVGITWDLIDVYIDIVNKYPEEFYGPTT